MYSNVVRTTRINVNGILIEYEGEDSGIGLLFASKAAVQVMKVRFGFRRLAIWDILNCWLSIALSNLVVQNIFRVCPAD